MYCPCIKFFKTRFASYLLLAIGVMISVSAYVHLNKNFEEREYLRFLTVTKQASMLVKNRMDAYRQTLYAGAGLFNASDNVSRAEWQAFVKSLKIEQNFPGVQGLGYSEVVRPHEKERHTARIRAEGFPTFDIKPPGTRDIYTSIIYLEPFNERNKRAFGYDMYSEEVRREALNRAIFGGVAALTGKVRLLQENNVDVQAGFLMYVPVYRKNMPLDTKEQRMAAIQGFVYAPFRAKDLMNGVLGNRYEDVDLEIYDGAVANEANLMFDAHQDQKDSVDDAFFETVRLNIDGRVWTLQFRPLKGFFDEAKSSEPLYVLIGGVLLSFAVFTVMLSLVRTKERAQELAERITKELSVSEERLRFALEGSGDGIWDWNIKTNEVFFSKRWKEMLGFAEDEISGNLEEWKRRVHPDDIERVNSDILAYFEGGTPIYINEHRVQTKDGSYKWILDRGIVVARDENGNPLRMVGSHTDITAQKEAEEKLKSINEHLSKMVEEESAKRIEKDKLLIQQSKLATMGEMIGAIGHQWRQPLNSLGILVQDTIFAYKYGELDEKYLEQFKENAMQMIRNMSSTIDDFKNFFSPNKKEEQFFIEDAIAQTLKILEAQFKNNDIKIYFDSQSIRKHSYICYKNELNQVILNILANAKDALLERKPTVRFVKIDVENSDDGVEISIEDSAGGIAEDIIGRVFDSYFTTKGEEKGTGIGLYMSKNIIEEHLGGKIRVENTTEGARFRIWLPNKDA